ncbi:MAG: hypothetical protein IPJ06_14255 [Saprospiraceae bacterium]|nr:hypothetical protein [Saprospiraceae bacterium]
MTLINDIANLQRKVEMYHDVLKNTTSYRQIWQDSLKAEIMQNLTELSERPA